MDKQQNDNDPAIQNLIKWVESTKDRGMRYADADISDDQGECPFISHTDLEEYLRNHLVVENLLDALFRSDDPLLEPLDAALIRRKYPKIFCLLIIIGKGRFINHFVEYVIEDQHLPLGLRVDNFPTATSDDHFFAKFYEKQWQFCVPELYIMNGRRFDAKEWILPIRRVKKLGEGGSATTYQIEVHGAYNQLDVDSSDPSQPGSLHSPGHQCTKNYVLKTYRNTHVAEKYYNSEWRALKRVHGSRSYPHIVGFYGGFILDGTYDILLEYADKGTLEEYLASTPPPCTARDIITFWQSFLRVTLGLSRIHGTRESSTEGPQIFQGWHQDIKPSNILIKSREGGSIYDFECKLADLGLSHFTKSLSAETENTDMDVHGTRAYGAPECYRSDAAIDGVPLRVKQGVDIWSFGCVLSEVATWVACNWNAVLEYRQQRQKETQRLPDFRDGDCFHNGQDVLETVQQNHAELVNSVRPCDYVTKSILKMIEEDMLRSAESHGRRDTVYLYKHSTQLTQAAKVKLGDITHDSPSQGMVHSGGETLIPPEPPQINGLLNFNPPPQRPYHLNKKHQKSLVTEGSPTRNSHHHSTSLGQKEHRYPQSLRRSPEAESAEDDSEPMVPPPRRSLSLPQHQSGKLSNGIPSPYGLTQPQSVDAFHDSPGRSSANRSNLRVNIYTPQNHPTTSPSPTVPEDHTTKSSQVLAAENQTKSSPPNTASVPIESTERRIPPPVWPVKAAFQWKSAKKNPKNNQTVKLPPESHLLGGLKGRDHAFVIDDSASMNPYWTDVRDLLDLLAYMVKRADPNRVDLCFAGSAVKHGEMKMTTSLLEIFDQKRPNGKQDMSARLSSIVSEYQKDLAKINAPKSLFAKLRSKETRPLSVYVFTDAVWQPVCHVSPVIKSLVSTLTQNNLHKQQVGIQFIRFGNQRIGIERLEDLDRLKLKGEVEMDIVDTEPYDGNVWKMLLGPINDWFDDDLYTSYAKNSPSFAPTRTSEKHQSTPG